MTTKSRPRSTTSTDASSLTRDTTKVGRSRTRSRRPPRKATQEQIEMTFAAAKAKDIIDESFDSDGELGSPEHRESLRFLAEYFQLRGVRVSRAGHVTLPTGACSGVNIERVLEKSYLSTDDFLWALKETGVDLVDGYSEEIFAVGWRHGFMYRYGDAHHEQPVVPIVLALNASTLDFQFDNRGDRVSVQDSALSPAERAFASQLPATWKRWQDQKQRSLLAGASSSETEAHAVVATPPSPPHQPPPPPSAPTHRERVETVARDRVQALLDEGLNLARLSRDLLVDRDKDHADQYGVLLVHESASAQMPRKRERIPLVAPGWWGEFFPIDASHPSKVKGWMPAIIMVGEVQRTVMLETVI